MADQRGGIDRDRVAVGAHHLGQRTGLTQQFMRVVQKLDPAAGGDGQHVVAADAGDFEFVGHGIAQPAHHPAQNAAVLARPFVAGLARARAILVDFDAVEMVFEQPVARVGRQLAWGLGRHAGFGARRHPRVGMRRQRIPGGQGGQAGEGGIGCAHLHQLDLPDRLLAGRGVGAA
ncbi:hypothetical protein D3C72_1654130 [compost metagenome]